MSQTLSKGYVARREAYNLAVLAELATLSPDHADALNRRGTMLGWWNKLAFAFSTGKPAAEVARSLATRPIA